MPGARGAADVNQDSLTAQLQQIGLTFEIALTLAVVLLALGLFLWNRIRVDVVALVVLAVLIVLGLITPEEGVSGFANEATITVALMMALSAGLLRTGFVDLVGARMARMARGSDFRLLLLIVAVVVPLSAFINNTAAVAILLPVIMGLTRDMGVPPSRMLIPLSYSGQLGGTLTLIGTSTNLLVAGLVMDLGLDRIHLFDITPPALVLTVIGVAYILTVGRWLVPYREASAELLEIYELREYVTGLLVPDGSPLAGKTLKESRFGEKHGLEVLRIDRGTGPISDPGADSVIEAGDLLLVVGNVAKIADIRDQHGLEISGAKQDLEAVPRLVEWNDEEGEGEADEAQLAEFMVPPRSALVGSRVGEVHLRRHYGLSAMAILRHGQPLHAPIASVRLRAGDILLVSGAPQDLRDAHDTGDLALLQAMDPPVTRRSKLWLATAILAVVVLLPALGVARIMVSALMGVVAMLLTGCLTPDEAYEEIDWMVVVLLGAILPLGLAMQNTGAAGFIAGGVVTLTEPLGPYGVLAAFFVLTSLLTELISNNGAAVVLTPIAIAAATTLGLSPLPFVVAVMFGASNAFMTPVGYQTNTFVYGPGGYRFTDFTRVGAPLGLLIAAAATVVIPIFFPF